jgi:bacteriocin-like protein
MEACAMTPTNNIDRELTEAELAHVVGGEVALQHEPLHSSSTSGSAGPRMSIKFSPEYTRH